MTVTDAEIHKIAQAHGLGLKDTVDLGLFATTPAEAEALASNLTCTVQLNRAELGRMTAEQIEEARAGGRCVDIMKGRKS